MPIQSYQNLSLAARDRTWSAADADKRVREWAGATEAPNAKYAKAFLFHAAPDDDDIGGVPDQFGDYKLPYADVIDGKLTAIPRALFAAAARLDQTDLADGDKAAAREQISKYYAKMRKQFGDDNLKAPWERAAPNAYERRSFVLDNVRIERRAGDSKPLIRGHAAVFNSPTQLWPGLREQVAPGAFDDSLKDDDVRALFNHDPNIVLGRNKAGTLRLAEDKQGLAIEIDPPDTQAARDLIVSMERGDIDQMSFAFRVESEQWEEAADGSALRTLMKVRLSDVSPVTYPAYQDTDVSVARGELRHFHELREAAEDEPAPVPEPADTHEIDNERDRLALETLL